MANSPPSSQFSFTAPFPSLKHRRVSLAGLPPTIPRVPWSFRDDTSLAGPSNPQHLSQSEGATSDDAKDPGMGKMGKIDNTDNSDIPPLSQEKEKKPRKKWSAEETQMLVDGCNRHGVGNWKTILSDPTLKFDNRSPVDLKDRFRTYFPDAYKKHYPNARTHLSSKVRSTLPDGSSLFEKTRSKRRRPFTDEEDRALKAGYEKHGTVWATIVKDPIFQEHNRRSTDLRDRFRNAFPELYQAAGYKPRNNTSKKKKDMLIEGSRMPIRAATDDQLALSSSSTGGAGPVRGTRRKRAQTSQGILLRGGTKSVPQSTVCSEDEDSSGQEDEDGEMSSGIATNVPRTPVLVDNVSTSVSSGDVMKKDNNLGLNLGANHNLDTFPTTIDDDDEMEMRLISLEPLAESLSDFPPSALDRAHRHHQSLDSTKHFGIDVSTHPHHAWSSAQSGSNSVNDGGGGGGGSNPGASGTSNGHLSATNGVKIGQSAWGTQDWLSPNPRLDHSFNGVVTNGGTGSSTTGTGTPSSYFSPSSPFNTFNLTPLNPTHPLTPATNNNSLFGGLTSLNIPVNYAGHSYYPSHQHHGVIERYDLWPPSSSALAHSSSFSAMNTVNSSSGWSGLSGSGTSGPGSVSAFSSSFGGDISSEVSFSDVQSTFSDEGVFDGSEAYNEMGDDEIGGNGGGTGGGSFRAITHHSDFAGDLIFGARGYGGGGFAWFGSAYTPAVGPASGNNGESGGGLGLVGINKNGEKSGEVNNRNGGGGITNGSDADGDPSADGKPANGTGSINPMQLHTPSGSLSGIDEIELAGITLNDSQDVDVDVDDVMEGTGGPSGTHPSANASEIGLGLTLTGLSSPLQRQRESRGSTKQPGPRQRSRTRGIAPSSASAGASPKRHRLTLGMSSLPHSHTHSHSHNHSRHHSNSLSLSLGPTSTASLHHKSEQQHSSSMASSSSSSLGRFSLDDLDLMDSGQDFNMNNLTPPATPMMQHAQQLRGMRRYSAFGLGLGSGPGLGFGQQPQQGQAQGLGGGMGGGPSQGQAQGGRSISVPPSEVRNSLGMTFVPMAGTGSVGSEGSERGLSDIPGNTGPGANANGTGAGASDDLVISAPGGVTVKRSLSSTVHHSHGPGHGHSLSLSTLPPLPSHSEIWRSSTPTAKGSRNSHRSTTPSAGGNSSSITTPSGGANSTSLFSMNTPPPNHIFSPSPLSTGLNGEFTNPDLPFLDLHYWHQNDQAQGGHGHGHGHGQGQNGFGAMMVDSTEEARQALDLAQPFFLNGHGHGGQGFGFGAGPGLGGGGGLAPATSASTAGAGRAMKALMGSVLSPNFSRHVTPFTARQQGGHQRGQSQQAVNPKDLVLNASVGVGGAGGDAIGRMDNKRKRASLDGGLC